MHDEACSAGTVYDVRGVDSGGDSAGSIENRACRLKCTYGVRGGRHRKGIVRCAD